MSRKLRRVLDDIQNAEKKIAEWQEHLKGLNLRREQLENAEIVKSVRSMKLGSREMLALLEGIQEGAILFYQKEELAGNLLEDSGMADADGRTMEAEEKYGMPKELASEREDLENEREN